MADRGASGGPGGRRGGPRGRGGRGGHGGGGGGGRGNRGGRGGGRPNDGGQDQVLQQLSASVQQLVQAQQQPQPQLMGYGAQPMGFGAQPMMYPVYGPPQPWNYPPQPTMQQAYYPPQPQWGYGQCPPGAYPPWTALFMAQGPAGTTVAPTPFVSPYQMAPTQQAPAQSTPTQAQDAQPTAPENPEPTHSQGRSGRSYRVRKHKRNPARRRPTVMERDEPTSQRFVQSPELGDEAATTEAARERQANEAEEEAEARKAAIETARQERINAQQSSRTQLEGYVRRIIAGIDQESFAIAQAKCNENEFSFNNEVLQRGLASLLSRILRFRRFVTTCADEVGEILDQTSDPAELTEIPEDFWEMVSSYHQERLARYRKDADQLFDQYTRLLNSNSG